MKIVLDTNVIVAAIQPGSQSSRQIVQWCFQGKLTPQLSNTLFLEYEEITRRPEVRESCHFTGSESEDFMDALLSVSRWVEIYYTWRPNLSDEADNHLIELSVAAGAEYLITHNVKDLAAGEIKFDQLNIATPGEFAKQFQFEV